MALSVNGKTCPICHSYLFDEDDVVYCPVCGAPHHRDCYNSVGHCGLEQFHGTENEYSPEKEAVSQIEQVENNEHTAEETDMPNICPRCMKELEKDAKVCPYCGMPRNGAVKLIRFDLFGGVNKNEDLGDGVTAEQAARFVAVNTQKYLPKFKRFKQGKKASFNWIAFLLPESWFFLRKMYKQGALALTVAVASNILSFPLIQLANGIVTNSRNELVQYILQKVSAGNYMPMVLAVISVLFTLALRIVCGVFGDYFYRNKIIKCAKDVKTADDAEEYTAKQGGLNLLMFLLATLVATYLPNFIYGFLS